MAAFASPADIRCDVANFSTGPGTPVRDVWKQSLAREFALVVRCRLGTVLALNPDFFNDVGDGRLRLFYA